ncbi:MAG: TRAP transporter substrate-binding protein [Burkholderiales bacterium]|nr:TRAP transporter substrate-binding protein [Burkholderiales bacterium]MDE1928213.1 TRAP transporter substrate-binding protein [Burkholderiales bacterium]MDE2157448.1 TRAP transporter substrate-binding protein [Burkholderiales bacterium]MDE2501574.1 TRAP transporter substrate-binding protein [Burkholderiales bacterium]
MVDKRDGTAHAWLARLLAVCACLGAVAAGRAQPAPAAPLHLHIVGGLAHLIQYTHFEEPFWTRELPRLTGGRVTAEIVPFDAAGLGGQEMLRLVQIGAVPFGTMLLSVSSTQEPELAAPDLAGLNPDIASARRSVAAYRPHLEQLLHERYGIRVLAVYVYPAQELFCARPITGLASLAGLHVRVSSPTQADFMLGLGAIPTRTAFADIVANLRNGNVDCAVTGTMSGHIVGLDRATQYLLDLPVNWGMAVFVANEAAWSGLPDDVQRLLERETGKLADRIWAETERETRDGVACDIGAAACTDAVRGHMTLVRPGAADARLRRRMLVDHVLPAWFKRCGPACAAIWRGTLAPVAQLDR